MLKAPLLIAALFATVAISGCQSTNSNTPNYNRGLLSPANPDQVRIQPYPDYATTMPAYPIGVPTPAYPNTGPAMPAYPVGTPGTAYPDAPVRPRW